MKLTLSSRTTLNNHTKMPLLGLGTWMLSEGKEAEQAVGWALEAGYRHIDTASIYRNERSVGNAVRESGVNREEIFVTTKIWNSEHDNPERALDESLKRLGMKHVDLYLIHWPVPERNRTWKVLEKLNKAGKCGEIGISNFSIEQTEELLKIADVIPAVNQVEFHPWLYQKELWEYCRKRKIQLEAYSPLARAEKMRDKMVLQMAGNYKKTPAQVLLRWAVQKNIVVIPKSKDKGRIEENAAIFDFEIKESDMKKLDGLNQNMHVVGDYSNER